MPDFFEQRLADLEFSMPPSAEKVHKIVEEAKQRAIDPTHQVKYGEDLIAVQDIPNAGVRAFMGLGHFPEVINQRTRHPYPYPASECPDCMPPGESNSEARKPNPDHTHRWPWSPDKCLIAGVYHRPWIWLDGGKNLACPGCGIDGT